MNSAVIDLPEAEFTAHMEERTRLRAVINSLSHFPQRDFDSQPQFQSPTTSKESLTIRPAKKRVQTFKCERRYGTRAYEYGGGGR